MPTLLTTFSCLLLASIAPTAPTEPDASPVGDADAPAGPTDPFPTDATPAADTETAAPAPSEAAEPAATDGSPAAEAPTTTAAEATNSEQPSPVAEPGVEAPPSAAPAPATVQANKPTRPDRPLRWRLDFSLGVDSTRIGDTGYLAFSKRRALIGTGIGARFDYRLSQRFFVGGGVHYSRFGTERDPYDGLLSTELIVHEPTVHARASLMTVEGVDVFADLGGGSGIVLDRISSTETDAKRRRTATGAFSATGGVSLYLPRQWLPNKQATRVLAGLETRFGYQFRGAVDMSTNPSLDDDPLRTTTADYGDLALRGFVWGVSLFVRVI